MVKEQFSLRPDLPRKGWILLSTLDHGSANFKCENCGNAHIRYKHLLENRRSGRRVIVGCVCAEHLTEDFTTPKLRERDLKGRVGRRLRFPTLNWVWSQNGNLRLKKDGMIFVLKRGKLGGWATSYPYTLHVQDQRFYAENPVVVDATVRQKLDAFRGRDPDKSWAWFVQATRKITEHDFRVLTRT